jgi:hypothetical protein
MLKLLKIGTSSSTVKILIDDELERMPLILRLTDNLSYVHCLHYMNYYKDVILEVDVRQDTGELNSIQITSGDASLLKKVDEIKCDAMHIGNILIDNTLWPSESKYLKDESPVSLHYSSSQLGIFFNNKKPKNYVSNGNISYGVEEGFISSFVVNDLSINQIEAFIEAVGGVTNLV